MTALDLMLFWLCLAIALRIFLFNRAGATYKRGYALAAWIIMQLFFVLAVLLISQRLCATQLPAITLPALVMFALAIFKARGNVAQLLRTTRGIFND